jgi:PilZ domain
MQDQPFPHRREFVRVPVHLAAEVTVQGERYAGGTMENVSLKGGFLRIANGPPEGATCDIRMHLDGTDVVIHAQGAIVRTGLAGCAIQFNEIVGLDSLEHLRNLILFNSHDPAQVEHEFHRHLGLKRDR